MKKIDIHAHLTTTNPLWTYASLKDEMQKHDVEKTVVLASYFPHKGSGISNYRVSDIVRGHDDFLMFGSLDFENYFFQGINELNSLALNGRIKGIKVYTGYQEVDLESGNMVSLLGLAAGCKIPVMFHTGYSFGAQRTQGTDSYATMVGAKEFEELVHSWPEVTFILSHLSKPYFSDMRELATENSNVYSDISGLIDSRREQADLASCVVETRRFLDDVGPSKLLFGTDFPVQTHEDSVFIAENALRGFSYEDKRQVYSENAREVLKL